MSSGRLTTQNATVATATVEVNTLTISGKQVTLAVFRQLRVQSLINSQTGTLAGTAWGHVNYCTPDCPWKTYDPYGHRHFVWENFGELRRCPVARGDLSWFELLPRDLVTSDATQEQRQAAGDTARKINALKSELWQLPQLFIAV